VQAWRLANHPMTLLSVQRVGRAPDPNVRFEIRCGGKILHVAVKLDRLRQAKRAYRLTGHLKGHV
jgi:hypothetical protein